MCVTIVSHAHQSVGDELSHAFIWSFVKDCFEVDNSLAFDGVLQGINKPKKFSRVQMNTDILGYFLYKFV